MGRRKVSKSNVAYDDWVHAGGRAEEKFHAGRDATQWAWSDPKREELQVRSLGKKNAQGGNSRLIRGGERAYNPLKSHMWTMATGRWLLGGGRNGQVGRPAGKAGRRSGLKTKKKLSLTIRGKENRAISKKICQRPEFSCGGRGGGMGSNASDGKGHGRENWGHCVTKRGVLQRNAKKTRREDKTARYGRKIKEVRDCIRGNNGKGVT